jgi:hypothetical protein
MFYQFFYDMKFGQDHFHLPLSTKALAEFHQLQLIIEDMHAYDNHDKWLAFRSSSLLKVSSAYKLAMNKLPYCLFSSEMAPENL